MALLIVGAISVVVLLASVTLAAALGAYKQKIEDTYLKQMSSALSQYKTSFAGNSFSEELLKKGEEKLKFISY